MDELRILVTITSEEYYGQEQATDDSEEREEF